MKRNLPVSEHEVVYQESANILSTTNPKGMVTYVNEDFVRISGFTSEELIGNNHNMVRHPDMPEAAFADLWATLQQGKAWMGIVKNRCKNGDYYWVDAYVTPIYENNRVVEYQSVRSKPSRERVARAEQVYQNLQEGKAPFSVKKLPQIGSLLMNGLIAFIPMVAIAAVLNLNDFNSLVAIMFASLMILSVLNHRKSQAASSLNVLAKEVVDNSLMQYIYTGRNDSQGEIELALLMQRAELSAMTGRMSDTLGQISHTVDKTAATLHQTQSQSSEMNALAGAMDALSSSMGAVNESVHKASCSSDECRQNAERGRTVVTDVISSIDGLAGNVSQASNVVNELVQSSQEIGSVLEVISGIAEQTNLLALNAAIEAARAGEQGRGFAVVADEVRSLATRTRESTHDISAMIDQLRSRAEQAVVVMKEGGSSVESSVLQVEETKHVLEGIISNIASVSEMNGNILAAVNQQQSATDEINSNISSLNRFSEETAASAEQTSGLIDELAHETNMCSRLITQFRAVNR